MNSGPEIAGADVPRQRMDDPTPRDSLGGRSARRLILHEGTWHLAVRPQSRIGPFKTLVEAMEASRILDVLLTGVDALRGAGIIGTFVVDWGIILQNGVIGVAREPA
jgi:hypothetical protein